MDVVVIVDVCEMLLENFVVIVKVWGIWVEFGCVVMGMFGCKWVKVVLLGWVMSLG